MKLAGPVPVLVKLQRPPPDMRIFLPTLLACSTTQTRRPRRPAVKAHISPAAPPPMMATSKTSRVNSGSRPARTHAHAWIDADQGLAGEHLHMAILDQALKAQSALR